MLGNLCVYSKPALHAGEISLKELRPWQSSQDLALHGFEVQAFPAFQPHNITGCKRPLINISLWYVSPQLAFSASSMVSYETVGIKAKTCISTPELDSLIDL